MLNCVMWKISEINFKLVDGFKVEIHCMKNEKAIGKIFINKHFQKNRDLAAVIHYIEIEKKKIVERCKICKSELEGAKEWPRWNI